MNTDLNERGLLREFSGVNRHDILSGGVQMIPVETPKGTFRVWTKRIGNHPTIKVLLLHGGPGLTHEYLEAFDSYFPQVGFEYYSLGTAPICRRSRTGTPISGIGSRQFLSLWTFLGWDSGDRVRPEISTTPERTNHLQHDGQYPRLQRVRPAGANASDRSRGRG
jgi:hypothetical protein